MSEPAPGRPEAFAADIYRAHAWYNRRMNERIYAAAATLTDEERKRDRGAFFGSIHLTLNHLLMADRGWLARFGCEESVWRSVDDAGEPIRIEGFAPDMYPRFDKLRSERGRTDRDIERCVGDLPPGSLGRTLEYRTGAGQDCRHPLWWALSHFFNHQTHHRGQVTTLLSQAGVDPGVTDMVIMLRDESWAPSDARTA